ncbi:MAG: extracellular solute-binding protein [candidate division NC10 bacterium]|nr:extracellular solute-binding protein [candidate division NC10 bacterium]
MIRVQSLRYQSALRVLVAAVISLVAFAEAAFAGELVVYSGRKEELIRPAIQAAEKALNLKVTLFTAGAGELARRIELEKASPRGDVFIGTTAGFAELMREKGLLDTFTSPLLKEIPAEFRSPDNSWVPITARVRVLMTNSNLVKAPEAPRSYFDLTDPRWKGKIAIASMGERTTVGWLAAILAVKGEEFTKKYVADLRANGLKVLKNNTEVRKAVASGEYAVGITNHYYYLLQLQADPKSPLAILYPDQGPADMGTPVFSITAALIKGAKNAEAGRSFLEFLLKPEGNRHLVEGEFEIPLLPGLPLPGADKGIKGLGQFKRPSLTQAQIADLEPKVERLFGSALTP